MLPSVYVTRPLPSKVLETLRARYAITSTRFDDSPDADRLALAFATNDAILATISDRIDATLLARIGGRARIIANFGAGLDHIDLAAARMAGVAVTNTPDAVTEATAELAILLMLMAARRAGEGERELRAGRWKGWQPTHLLGTTLQGKTLGLVGFGLIGRATAAKARGLGMTILYHARRPALDEVAGALKAGYVGSLDELAATSDVLSLHVPGGTETNRLIDAAMIARMRPHAILVNTSRGSVVDEAAVAGALAQGRIAAAGFDVYEREPAIHPNLISSDRAVLLPHLGSATIEARTAMGMQAIANLDAFFAGREPPNRVA